jgi:hypothetical protein
MDEFIRREHLIIFKRRLVEVKDDAQRQLLLKLLAGANDMLPKEAK